MTHKRASLGPTAVWQCVPSLTWKKTITRRLTAARIHGLVLATFLLGLVIATPMASAGEWTDHSGTICKNYNAGEANYIDYLTYGTRSVSSSYTYVICPLTRNTAGIYGAYVYVYVAGSPTSCTAYSYDYYGGGLVSNSVSGTGLLGIPLYGYGNSTPYSNYSVLCYLPGNAASVVTSVDIYEY